MAEHVAEWLGAYHDGELRGARLRQVEQHLMECAECRTKLETTRGLSTLLHDSAPVGDFLPTERFVANLALNLPRQPEQVQPRTWIEIGWWLIPVGLLGALLFLQITFSLSEATQFAMDSGLFNGNLAWLQGNPPQTEWFAATMNFFGDQVNTPVREVLSAANNVDLFISQITWQYLLQGFLAACYLGWLISWWQSHQRQLTQNLGSFSQS